MRKRIGIIGTLGAIALGAGAMSAPSSALAQSDLSALCSIILDTDSVGAFNATPEAVAALNDPTNPCNSLAAEQYARLSQTNDQTSPLTAPGELSLAPTKSPEGYAIPE